MATHDIHEGHEHTHGPNCGHLAIQHLDHVDYLHSGHLHYPHDGHVDEHILPVSDLNPDGCTPSHACTGHDPGHSHGPNCGHEAIPHGDHTDYVVNGHLHFPHDVHCDDHGGVQVS